MPNATTGSCPLCQSQLEPPVYQLSGIPTLDGAVGESLEKAMSIPEGDVEISLCGNCGWIGNAAFDASRLSYEKFHFSLQHSPAFESFVVELVDRLNNRYDLEGRKVLDVGCGNGDFLRTFAARVTITGLGVDPSIAPGTEHFDCGTVTYERGVLQPRHAGFGANLVCCRHVLNSMPDPIGLLSDIRSAAGDEPSTVFYFEVPYADRTFNDDIVWNLASNIVPGSTKRRFGCCASAPGSRCSTSAPAGEMSTSAPNSGVDQSSSTRSPHPRKSTGSGPTWSDQAGTQPGTRTPLARYR